MMGVVNESKIVDTLQKMVDGELEYMQSQTDEMGLGEMDELDEIESIDKIELTSIDLKPKKVAHIKIYVNSNRKDFDMTVGSLKYIIDKYIPGIDVVYEIIDTRTFGPGIDF